MMKKGAALIAIALLSAILCPRLLSAEPVQANSLSLDAVSAILMDSATGTVLYEQNPDEPLPPASVTKVMTLLLVMEAVDSGAMKLEDPIQTSANAASMGGSQIYLKEGETMSAEDMIKSVVISSANDAAVALAEHICGSEDAFVVRMNERATELGLKNTRFENTNGLDDTVENHVMSARDIAVISRELMKHDKILEYSGTWMDTVRDGAFGLTNTNRLVRFYNGATGLKTGSTSKARFCISATAKRGDMHLIAVIMGSPTRDTRNEAAKQLLDYGFANFALYSVPEKERGALPVTGGITNICTLSSPPFDVVVRSGKRDAVTETLELPETLAAPIAEGELVGRVVYSLDGETIGEAPVTAAEAVAKISYGGVLLRLLRAFLPG